MHGGMHLRLKRQKKVNLLGKSGLAVAFVEFVNTSSDVNEFLLTGEERVAISTDTDALFFSGGINIPNLAASTNDFGRTEIRMNIFFHSMKPYVLLLFSARGTASRYSVYAQDNIHGVFQIASFILKKMKFFQSPS